MRPFAFLSFALFGLAVIAPVAATTTACTTENTCAKGSALTNVRLVGPPQASVLGSTLRIVWDGGGVTLPRTYFAAAKVKTDGRDVGPDGPLMEEAIEAPNDREMVVTLRASPFAVRGALRFTVLLPDRKQFISCEREDEAKDVYELKVDAEIGPDGNVSKSSLTEVRQGGE